MTKSGASMLAHEIKSIVHLPEKSMIVINLKTRRECLEPHLIGRMSGPMLAKLVWEEKGTSQKDSYVIVGRYNLPSLLPGKYFLEILATMCNKLTVHRSNITSICMVDPSRQQLTEDGDFINVLPSSLSMLTDDENSRLLLDAGMMHHRQAVIIHTYHYIQDSNLRTAWATTALLSDAVKLPILNGLNHTSLILRSRLILRSYWRGGEKKSASLVQVIHVR